MPDTTPLPIPPCPREDCRATIDHFHGLNTGDTYACERLHGARCGRHEEGSSLISRCYAPRTAPTPDEDELRDCCNEKGPKGYACTSAPGHIGPHVALTNAYAFCEAWNDDTIRATAGVRFPDGWERGHAAKYWIETGLTPYGLTLDEERAPGVLNWLGVDYYRPDSPHMPAAPQPNTTAPARPTLRPLTDDDYRAARDAYARAEHSYLDAAVDAIHARLAADCDPAPQPINPADVRVGDRVRLTIDGVVMMTPDRRIDISDLVGLLDDQPYTEKVYLVDRPDPDAPLVGTIARVIASGAGARAVLDAIRAEYVIEPKAVQS